jgi:hypothetical protein
MKSSVTKDGLTLPREFGRYITIDGEQLVWDERKES